MKRNRWGSLLACSLGALLYSCNGAPKFRTVLVCLESGDPRGPNVVDALNLNRLYSFENLKPVLEQGLGITDVYAEIGQAEVFAHTAIRTGWWNQVSAAPGADGVRIPREVYQSERADSDFLRGFDFALIIDHGTYRRHTVHESWVVKDLRRKRWYSLRVVESGFPTLQPAERIGAAMEVAELMRSGRASDKLKLLPGS